MGTTNSVRTFIHQSPEENLLAAKRAVRLVRHAHLHRRTGCAEGDVIEIMAGARVIERHICHVPVIIGPTPRRPFRVEELALYR